MLLKQLLEIRSSSEVELVDGKWYLVSSDDKKAKHGPFDSYSECSDEYKETARHEGDLMMLQWKNHDWYAQDGFVCSF